MQISRHWRLNAQRYRLEGLRYEDDEMTLADRTRYDENMPETLQDEPQLVAEGHVVSAA
jgi:hypothetical protein